MSSSERKNLGGRRGQLIFIGYQQPVHHKSSYPHFLMQNFPLPARNLTKISNDVNLSLFS